MSKWDELKRDAEETLVVWEPSHYGGREHSYRAYRLAKGTLELLAERDALVEESSDTQRTLDYKIRQSMKRDDEIRRLRKYEDVATEKSAEVQALRVERKQLLESLAKCVSHLENWVYGQPELTVRSKGTQRVLDEARELLG